LVVYQAVMTEILTKSLTWGGTGGEETQKGAAHRVAPFIEPEARTSRLRNMSRSLGLGLQLAYRVPLFPL